MNELRTRYKLLAEMARVETVIQILEVPEVITKIAAPDLISFDDIGHRAFRQLEGWTTKHFARRWREVPRLRRGQLKSFDVSLWYGETLCGLCFATPKKSKFRIKLMLLEGHPDSGHPLKGFVAAFMLLAIENYAKKIGIPQIMIPDPLPGAVPLYIKLGFTHDAERRLVKGVELSLA